MNRLLPIAAFCLMTSSAVASPATEKAVLGTADIDQRLGETVPMDTVFTAEDGRRLPLKDVVTGEKPWILLLAYYNCPHLCGLVLKDLPSSLADMPFTLGRDYEVVTVSIDPADGPADSAAARKRFLSRSPLSGSQDAWHFMTGTTEAIKKLASAAGFQYAYDPQSGEYAHGAGLMVLTPDGTLSRYLFGVKYATRDLRLSLVEAGRGSIGSAVDKVLLRCYQYDPETGEYTLFVTNLLRAGGAVTVFFMLGFLWRSWRRD